MYEQKFDRFCLTMFASSDVATALLYVNPIMTDFVEVIDTTIISVMPLMRDPQWEPNWSTWPQSPDWPSKSKRAILPL